jgi:type IV pilus assembly protein PilA
MKKPNKKQQGFTLVEVIVVAVIVAVLAAVAIPLYMGYIKDTRNNVCQNNAAAIATTIQAKLAQNISYSVPASGSNISIPNEDGTSNSSIVLPSGYTFTTGSNNVWVNGPGNSNSTAFKYR